jgi:hypothetical protein
MNFSNKNILVMTSISSIGALAFPENNTHLAILLLSLLMGLDMISGIMASYIEEKKEIKPLILISRNKMLNDFLYFLNTGIIYKIRVFINKFIFVISSKKLKLLAVKILLYFGSILMVYLIETVFLIKKFNLSFSELKISLTISTIFFFCIIEFWSIFFENFKRMGIDLKKIILKFLKGIISIKNEVNNIKD